MHVAEPAWPYREFREYLRSLMEAAGIQDHVDLYRASGVAQSVFSRWDRGESQPSRANLRKVATALNVPAAKLFVAAGLMNSDELDMSGMIDPSTLPAEIRDFIALYLDGGLTADQQRYARQTVAYIASGLRAELAKSQVKPSGRRRAG
jgi:transcriptional regulator with XRE-family HTH domain